MRRVLRSRAAFAAANLVAIGITQQALASNLLVNPGFEAPPSGQTVDSLCSGWNFQLDCQRAGFYNHTTGGTKSIWLKTFEPVGGGITQNVPVTAGSDYTLNTLNLFEAGYNQSAAFVQLGLVWLDSSSNPIGTPAALNIDPASNPPTGVWNSYSVTGTAPVNATQVMVSLGWSGGQVVTGQSQSAFFDDVDLEGAGTAPTGSIWIVDGSGDWNLNADWANGVVPNGVGAEADFFSGITSNHTVFSDVGITAGVLNFNNANTYVIAGAGSLTMQVSSGSAQIIVQQGTQKLNIPTTIASNTVFNVSAGANLIVADPLTITSGKTVTQTGGGTVTYQSIVNVLGGAGIVFGNSTHAHEVDIAASGTASIGGTSSVLTVDDLSNGGKIDVKNNTLVISYGSGTSPAATVKSQLTSGYNNGAWNGTGINTSSATSKTGVGWSDDTVNHLVTAKYTYYGDANLDGKVTTADFTALAAHFNAASASAIWANGDFNYDGKVNALDFNAIATNFGAAPLSAPALGALVPEPISGSALLLGSALVAGIRRRRVM